MSHPFMQFPVVGRDENTRAPAILDGSAQTLMQVAAAAAAVPSCATAEDVEDRLALLDDLHRAFAQAALGLLLDAHRTMDRLDGWQSVAVAFDDVLAAAMERDLGNGPDSRLGSLGFRLETHYDRRARREAAE